MPAYKPQTETMHAKKALQDYLLMGPDRSLAKLAAQMGKPPSYKRTLETWSSAFNWVEQARQYDQELLDKERKRHQQDVEKMNDRHAKIGMEMQRRAIERLQELANTKQLTGYSAIQLLKIAIDIERMARGEAAQRFELGANQEQFDTIIKTIWGRGTDPRRVVDADTGNIEQPVDEPQISVEFGTGKPVEATDEPA